MRLYNIDIVTGIADTLTPTNLMKSIKAYPKRYIIRTGGKSLDYLSNQLYGSVEYWIVLAEYNNIVNPYVVPDAIYYIPDKELQRLIDEAEL